MNPLIRPYVMSPQAASRLKPANDRGRIFIGMLPFSKLPFLACLLGLCLLMPLVAIQKSYEIYASTKGKWISQAALDGRLALSELGLKVPHGFDRVMRFEKHVTTLKVQRIGSFILPRSGDDELQLEGSIDLMLSDVRTRPDPKVILQGIAALQKPQLMENRSSNLTTFSLQKGPITRADHMYIADQVDGGIPFFALCENRTSQMSSDLTRQPRCSGYFKVGRVFVEAKFSKLALGDWQLHVSSLRNFIDELEKAASQAPEK